MKQRIVVVCTLVERPEGYVFPSFFFLKKRAKDLPYSLIKKLELESSQAREAKDHFHGMINPKCLQPPSSKEPPLP
jgi:hypothetical protein